MIKGLINRESVDKKMQKLGEKLPCRICEKYVDVQRMLEHNKICVNIKQLEDQLSEINYWLISSSKQILLLKNTINFELIESYTSVKKNEKIGKR